MHLFNLLLLIEDKVLIEHFIVYMKREKSYLSSFVNDILLY